MNINQYWEIIKERKLIVIIAFLTTVITTAIGSTLIPPKYEATAALVLDYDSSNPMNLSLQPVIPQSVEYINTQIEIIKSRNIAVRVIDSLKLDQHPDIIDAFNRAKKAGPDIKVWLADTFLSNALKVEPARDTRFLYIKYYSSDPAFSAAVANAYAKVYGDYNLELKVMPFKEAEQWFSNKIEAVKGRSDQASENLLEYQKKKELVSQEGRYYDDSVQRLEQINRELVSAKTRLYETKVALSRINDSKGAYETLPEVIGNAFIQNLKTQKIRLEASRSELSGKVGIKHPQYVRIQSELQTITSKLNAELKNIIDAIRQDFTSATERVKNLEKAMAGQKGEVLNQNISRYEMDSMNREAESYKQAYDAVLKKFNETALQSDINSTNVFLVDAAVAPTERYSPNIRLNMFLSVLVGLFLSVGLAFFFDYIDDTIKSGDVIEREFGTPVLGAITAISEV